ncbi:MAG: hypothetical protein V4447_10825 [Pseudomonadota bacterium]
MKAYELTKDGCMQRGRIWMIVEGKESAVRKIEKELNIDWTNTQVEEDGDKDGEIAIMYAIDRNEKQEFMDAYKVAKKI